MSKQMSRSQPMQRDQHAFGRINWKVSPQLAYLLRTLTRLLTSNRTPAQHWWKPWHHGTYVKTQSWYRHRLKIYHRITKAGVGEKFGLCIRFAQVCVRLMRQKNLPHKHTCAHSKSRLRSCSLQILCKNNRANMKARSNRSNANVVSRCKF